MLTTIIAISALSMSAMQEPTPLQCVARPEAASAAVGTMDFGGARYGFCCAGCLGGFEKNAATQIEAAAKANRTIGVFLFDPVAGTKIDPKKAEGGWVDYKSTRFFFASKANKTAFEANAATIGVAPKKEALYCPVMKHPIKSYADAGTFSDFGGVRYYLCCADCLAKFKAAPSTFTANAANFVTAPKATPTPKAKP